MKQFLGILTALAVLVASAAVLYLEEIYLNNRMFTLYSAFFLATLVAWYFDFPRPDWMHMAGVQDVRTRLGRKKIPGSVHSGAAIHGLHEFKTIEMSFRAATYCEDTDKICAESFDIASEKVFI